MHRVETMGCARGLRGMECCGGATTCAAGIQPHCCPTQVPEISDVDIEELQNQEDPK